MSQERFTPSPNPIEVTNMSRNERERLGVKMNFPPLQNTLRRLSSLERANIRNNKKEIEKLRKEIPVIENSIFGLREFRKTLSKDSPHAAVVNELEGYLTRLWECLQDIVEFEKDTGSASPALIDRHLDTRYLEARAIITQLRTLRLPAPIVYLARRVGIPLGVILGASLFVHGVGKPTQVEKELEKDGSKTEELETRKMIRQELPEEVGSPGMRNSGERPGEFERGEPFAKIKNGTPFEELYVTGIYGFERDGRRVKRKPNFPSFSWGMDEVEVEFYPQTYSPGDPLVLPMPYQYARNGQMAIVPETRVQSGLSDDQEIILNPKNSTEIGIGYTLSQIHPFYWAGDPEAYREYSHLQAHPRDMKHISEVQSLMAKLQNTSDFGERGELLEEYLRPFLYIVSSDLQNLLDQISGNREKLIEILRLGDCDVLSDHVAGVLNDAGIPSAVATGYFEEDGELFTELRHAQVVFEDKDRKSGTFETTLAPRNAFVNVSFRSEDRKILEEKIQAINALTDERAREEVLEKFRSTLDEILSDPYYEQFRPKYSPIESLDQLFKKNFWKKIKFSINDFQDISLNERLVIELFILCAGMAIAGLGARRLLMRGYDKRTKKYRRQSLLKTMDVVTGEGLGEKPRIPDSLLEKRLVDIFKNVGLDPERIRDFSLDEQRALFYMDVLRYETSVDYVHAYTQNPLAALKWRRMLRKLARAERLTFSDIDRIMRKFFDHPKIRAFEKRGISHFTDSVWRMAKEQAVSIPQVHARTPEDILTLFDIQGSSVRKGRKVGGDERSYEARRYVHGDTPRDIDWRLTARQGQDILMVRPRRAEDSSSEMKGSFRFVIDLPSIQIPELTKFAGLLLYLKGQKNIGVSEIAFYAFGKSVGRIEPRLLERMMDSKDMSSIRSLLSHIRRNQIQSFFFPRKIHGMYGIDIASGAMLPAQEIQRRSPGKDTLTLVMGGIEHPEGSGLYYFRRDKDKNEDEGQTVIEKA